MSEAVKKFLDLKSSEYGTHAEHGLLRDLLTYAAMIKHSSFEAEKEWRLISRYTRVLDGSLVRCRPGRSTLIPYLRLPLHKGDRDRTWAIGPIDIFVGPTPHKELALQAVQCLLRSKGLERRRVENSTIPYRDW